MKKLIILMLSSFSFSNIFNQSFNVNITEKAKKYKKEYVMNYNPKKIRIEILSPEINKGEIYTYENNKKYIYYPILDQTVEQTFSSTDSDIIKIIEDIKNINKTVEKNGKKYIVENGLVKSIASNNYKLNVYYDNQKRPNKIILKYSNEVVEYLWKY